MAKKGGLKKGQKVEQKIDDVKLTKLLEEGVSAQEMSKQFGNVGMSSLRSRILRLCMTAGKIYNVPGLYDRGPTSSIKFGKLGLRISPSALSTFKQGDRFSISIEEDTITLKKEAKA